MSSDFPAANGTNFRLSALERRLDRFENLEPAVMKQEILDMKEDIRSMAQDMSTVKKMFMGFIITFALGTTTLVAFIITTVHPHA
jgi:hypothetical protein